MGDKKSELLTPEQQADIMPSPVGTGVGGVTMEGDDFSPKTKETLALYLSKLTKTEESKNHFPIEPGSRPSPVDVGPTGGNDGEAGTKGFTTKMTEVSSRFSYAVSEFDTISNSGKFDDSSDETGETLATFLGKSSVEGHGNTLLAGVKGSLAESESFGNTSGKKDWPTPDGDTPSEVVQQKISGILRHNRFNPSAETPFIDDNKISGAQFGSQQTTLGSYNPNADQISKKELRRVAMSILLRQTGHATEENADPLDETTAGLIGEGLLSLAGTVQTGGAMADIKNMSAAQAYARKKASPEGSHTIQKAIIPDSELILGSGDGERDGEALSSRGYGSPYESFGAMNSPLEPFASVNPINQLTFALRALVDFLILAAIFSFIISMLDGHKMFVDAVGGTPSRKNAIEMDMGSSAKKTMRGAIYDFLGIPRLRNDFFKATWMGLTAFLGIAPIEPPANDPAVQGGALKSMISSILKSAVNLLMSPGYYATMSRVVRRDVGQIGSKFADSAAGKTANPLVTLLDLLLSLNSSASWRFMMYLAVVGEKRLNHKTPGPSRKIDNYGMKQGGQASIVLSRQTSDKPDLAWRHRSSPGVFMLPYQMQVAYSIADRSANIPGRLMTKVGDSIGSHGQPLIKWHDDKGPEIYDQVDHEGRTWRLSKTGRLTAEEVMVMEDKLESEYVPFYFHDLRTNEIISFHAFLSDLSDKFSTNYADSSGYGRIDPIKIYKSTERSISLTFHIVATGPKDFDSLWASINKLTTLLYPQWSTGKVVQVGDHTSAAGKRFVMPFSQIPTASPMIRLRIGDMMMSNYSRFGLARLFGIGDAKLTPMGQGPDGQPSDVASAEYKDKDQKQVGNSDRFQDSGGMSSAIFDVSTMALAELELQKVNAKLMKEAERRWNAPVTFETDLSQATHVGDDNPNGFYIGEKVWMLPGSYYTFDTLLSSDSFIDKSGDPTHWIEGKGRQKKFNPDKAFISEVGPEPVLCYVAENQMHHGPGLSQAQAMDELGPEGSHTSVSPGKVADQQSAEILKRAPKTANPDSQPGPPRVKGLDKTSWKGTDAYYKTYLLMPVDIDNPNLSYTPQSHKAHEHQYMVSRSGIQGIPPQKLINEVDAGNSRLDQMHLVDNFFNPKNNGIVAGFESTMGRGLAGFITSMDFDYKDATWEIDPGSRAPKMMKISLSFAPIHDITPGLDSHGFNRAPIYPVGKIMNPLTFDGKPAGGRVSDTSYIAIPDQSKDASSGRDFNAEQEARQNIARDNPGNKEGSFMAGETRTPKDLMSIKNEWRHYVGHHDEE